MTASIRLPLPRFLALLLTGAALISTPLARVAQAQPAATGPIESRAQLIAKEQSDKSRAVKPYEPTGAEKAIETAEKLLISPPPVYPWFGSIYPGGLFALGAGTRRPFGDTGLFDIHAGYSLRGYTGVDASLHLPELVDGRVRVDVRGQFINAPKVAFYGAGPNSDVDDKAMYLYRPTTIGATVSVEPVRHVTIGGGLDYLNTHTDAGKGGTSIEQRFNAIEAPGLGVSPRYTRTSAFAGYDWRTSPGYTTRGGWYHVEWYDYFQENRGGGFSGFSFQRTDAEVQQFIPLMRANWVIALRGLVSTTETKDGDRVPYFLMPDLGGGSELRGYPSFRFRDNHRLLLTGEYRWTAGQFVDMALFVDSGKVAAERDDLDFNHLKTTYGVGVRFHTPAATVLRIDVAKTNEGIGLIFTAGDIF